MTLSTEMITRGDGPPGPLPTRDSAAYAHAYTTVLGWPVALGHRYRPRGGCTCREAEDASPCPAPGAHPLPGWQSGHHIGDFATSPGGTAVIAPTVPFDAVVLPRQVGMAAAVDLDRRAGRPVPCMTTDTRIVFLTRPSTARAVVESAAPTEVVQGVDGWVALPPSHGVRWDAPPWDETSGKAAPLPHGDAVWSSVVTAAGAMR